MSDANRASSNDDVSASASASGVRGNDSNETKNASYSFIRATTTRLTSSSAFIVFVTCLLSVLIDRMTPVRSSAVSDHREAFAERRARAHARTLESGGARATGTPSEWSAFAYVDTTLTDALRPVSLSNATTVERARRTHDGFAGGSWRTTYGGIASVGARIRSARAQREGWEEHAVVLSVHIDTVHASVGGSDNGANVATALETTRALAQRLARVGGDAMCDVEARRCAAVIVMFSTAEEEGLAGAHGLVRTHEWFSDAKVRVQLVLNLESMGAGGPHRLFQARADSDIARRALRAWARHAPRAIGTVLSEDIFNSGVINSGTDFAIFRRYGDVPAILDFAFVERTSVYHTPRDRVKYMRPGSLQHSGENILEFMAYIVAHGGFEGETNDERAARPMSWYTIPGYGMVTHDSPRVDSHVVFLAVPLLTLATIIYRTHVGEFFTSRTLSAEETVAHMENTFRALVTTPLVLLGSALAWIAAVFVAAAAPVICAYTSAEPNLYISRPLGLIALSGSASFIAFIVTQKFTAKLTFALVPLSEKMKLSDQAWRITEWSLLIGQVVVWGLAASQTTRAGIGSSYAPLLWLVFPTSIAIAPALLTWFGARSRDYDMPSPPSGTKIALSIAAPLWITSPSALLLLRVLQGVGSRVPVDDEAIYLYDGIAGAVIGGFTAMTTSLFAPSLVISKDDPRQWLRAVKFAGGVLACALVYTLSFMRGAGAQWTTLAPQPLVLTHIVRASSQSAHIVIARAGASTLRGVESVLRENPTVLDSLSMECSANATFDIATAIARGACVVSGNNLYDEMVVTGSIPPSFGELRSVGRSRRVEISVGDGRRWSVSADKRCVERVAVLSVEIDAPTDEDWVVIDPYERGRATRAILNGVGGDSSARTKFTLWYQPRASKNSSCSEAVRLRADYTARTPSIAKIELALPKWAAPFGKHLSPQWLALYETLDVS